MTDARPYLWILDSSHKPLADSLDVFESWADIAYLDGERERLDWSVPPDAIFFSAEISGGAAGEAFASLVAAAADTPLLAVARLRSLAQAVAFFRAGATDYLSLPLDKDEARDRLAAALERAEQRILEAVAVELEPIDADTGEVSLAFAPSRTEEAEVEEVEEDILAELESIPSAKPESRAEENPKPAVRPDGDEAGEQSASDGETDPEEEPVTVDGLPIPTLWEELPCGLLVFDSLGNLVFANSLGLHLFGHVSLAELQDVLENRRASFAAHAANHKPLPDNQWPHVLAARTRTARSAVLSVEKPDRRRVWLRIDCLPHLSEGKITRLSLTIVNLTGELPPLAAPAPPPKRDKQRHRSKRRK